VEISAAGPTPSSSSRGCSVWRRPTPWPVNPLEGEPSTGEPCAGDPHARFGGREPQTNAASLPLSRAWGSSHLWAGSSSKCSSDCSATRWASIRYETIGEKAWLMSNVLVCFCDNARVQLSAPSGESIVAILIQSRLNGLAATPFAKSQGVPPDLNGRRGNSSSGTSALIRRAVSHVAHRAALHQD